MDGDDIFHFFEVVGVVSCDKFPELVGQFGFVVGKTWRYEDPEPHGPVDVYGVMMFGRERMFGFAPNELKTSGYLLATTRDDRGHLHPVEVEKFQGHPTIR